MELHDVRVDVPTNTPVVLLRESEGLGRTLPIWIGKPEASAIAAALRGVPQQRPFTHDLMKDLLIVLGVSLERIVITELRDKIYYAEIHLKQGERTHVLSSRPSDAIALAVRLEVPIYAADSLVESEGVMMPADDEEEEEAENSDPEEVVEEFRHFIEAVRPEDFRD
jgi:uncharacterized protein